METHPSFMQMRPGESLESFIGRLRKSSAQHVSVTSAWNNHVNLMRSGGFHVGVCLLCKQTYFWSETGQGEHVCRSA